MPIRVDEVALRAPRDRGDGTRVYEAVLVKVGDRLKYPWGTEIPTREALSDPAYLESLRGVSFAVHHPKGGLVRPGASQADGKGRRVGSVIGSRFDEAEQAVVIEIAVHEPKDQVEVERLGKVSEAYHADTRPLGQGVSEQIRRRTNSVVATNTPRAESADIRTDEESTMDIEKALEMIRAADDRTAVEKKRADEAEAKVATLEGEKQARADQATADAKTRADEIDRLANERAADLLKLQARADALDVQIPENLVSLADRKAHVAKALGCPDKTDAEAYIAGIEKARADSGETKRGKAASAFADSAKPAKGTTAGNGPKWKV